MFSHGPPSLVIHQCRYSRVRPEWGLKKEEWGVGETSNMYADNQYKATNQEDGG